MPSTIETLARKTPALFDSTEEYNETPWAKALARYRAKGMSETEINKYRTAYQQKQDVEKVKSIASKSKK